MKSEILKYLAQIGRRGGQKSLRTLTPDQARAMVAARIAKQRAEIQKGAKLSCTSPRNGVEVAPMNATSNTPGQGRPEKDVAS